MSVEIGFGAEGPGEPVSFGDLLNSMMQQALMKRVVQRSYDILQTVYSEIVALEPEQRNDRQDAVMRFCELIHVAAVKSLGMAGENDLMADEEHFAEMRTGALQMHEEFVKLMQETEDFADTVGKDIKFVMEGIENK
jgi:hypothetical protein